MLSVSIQETLYHIDTAMSREAQVADAAVCFLLQQIVQDAVPGIKIGVDIALVNIVEEIEIKIGRAAFFQLLGTTWTARYRRKR